MLRRWPIVLLLPHLWSESALAADELAVYLFKREGCPHCERAAVALTDIAATRPGVRIERHDIFASAADRQRLIELASALDIDVTGVPVTVIGGRAWVGYLDRQTTGREFERQIDHCLQHGCPDPVANPLAATPDDARGAAPRPALETPEVLRLPWFGEVSTRGAPLVVITVMLATIDGFNPCAMWVLVFLLGILAGLRDRRRMWLLGGSFVMASAAVYLLILGAWLQAFLWLGSVPGIRLVMGVVALIAAAHYLRQFVTNPAGVCEVSAAPARQRVLARLKGLVRQPDLMLALAGIVLLAVAVNSIELMCSAGVPAIFTHLLAQAALPPLVWFGYLLLYVIVFMLDDLVVLAIALTTMELTGLTGVHSRWASLLGAVLLVGIAAVLFGQTDLFDRR